MAIEDLILRKYNSGKKGYFVLLDPDKKGVDVDRIVRNTNDSDVDAILIGGSKKKISGFEDFLDEVRVKSNKPVILFPGSHYQISKNADCILLLSLLNSKSLKYLIGEHIDGGEHLVKSGIEILPTAYIVIADDMSISVAKRANISPIRRDDAAFVKKYLYAAQIMSYKLVYLEAGSGSSHTVHPEIIKLAKKIIDKPLIVGGGINSEAKAKLIMKSGADFIVTGNAIEQNPDMINVFCRAVKEFSS